MDDLKIKNSNILIVDDKKTNIDILKGFLEIQGYTNVKTTTDSRLAVGLYKSFNPDIILLDLMMPYLNGFQVMEQLKELIPPDIYVPILVLTADISFDTKQKALSSGAKDFIAKPFDLIEVGLRIYNLLCVRYLYKQLQSHNQSLEAKVKERTFDLEKVNLELIDAKNKAEDSNRLKTAFLNNISHEIRTPFTGILGFLAILQTDDLSPSEREDYVRIVNESADRLMNTINDIVEISQIQAGQIKLSTSETKITTLAKELFVKYKAPAESKGLEFKINNNLPSDSDYINTDYAKLNSILMILINNAIKFTTEGLIECNINKNHSYVEFSVRDTGIGIPENAHKVIFDQFMQADVYRNRQFEGQGLGLAIAKAYVEILGGKIWVESEPGKGSIFYFTIPYNKRNLKVLIAEDNEISERFITMGIHQISDEILHVKNGLEAVDVCRNIPDIDLVLMDIRMPEMNGYEATRQIRQFNKDVIIIAQTAYALVGDRDKAIEAGCNDYISKPIKTSLLIETIKKHFI